MSVFDDMVKFIRNGEDPTPLEGITYASWDWEPGSNLTRVRALYRFEGTLLSTDSIKYNDYFEELINERSTVERYIPGAPHNRSVWTLALLVQFGEITLPHIRRDMFEGLKDYG